MSEVEDGPQVIDASGALPPQDVPAQGVEPAVNSETAFGGASLEARMQEHRDEVEGRVAAEFVVPRWPMLGVKLRMVSYPTLRKIRERHVKQRDKGLRELYSAAEELLTATAGFFLIDDDGSVQRDAEGEALLTEHTWLTLARMVNKLPDTATPRQAIISICGDNGVVGLWAEWLEFLRGERESTDTEVAQAF